MLIFFIADLLFCRIFHGETGVTNFLLTKFQVTLFVLSERSPTYGEKCWKKQNMWREYQQLLICRIILWISCTSTTKSFLPGVYQTEYLLFYMIISLQKKKKSKLKSYYLYGRTETMRPDLFLNYLHHFMEYIPLGNMHMNKISTVLNQRLQQLTNENKLSTLVQVCSVPLVSIHSNSIQNQSTNFNYKLTVLLQQIKR